MNIKLDINIETATMYITIPI